MRVVVVDDMAPVRRALRRLLVSLGHQVWEAAGIAEAMAAADAHRPDVVVSDVDLAGESGFDLVRRLRALDRSPRVVLMTGNLHAQQPPDLNDVPLLRKPFGADELRAVLVSSQTVVAGD